MMSLARTVLAAFLAVLALTLSAPSASAHAHPLQSSPAVGAQLAVPPTEVWIDFTQAPDEAGSAITVLDARGVRADVGSVVEGVRLTARLPPDLPEGGYVVRWVALSRADGHTTKGAFGFAVGEATAPAGAQVESEESPATITAARAALYVGLALACGGVVYGFLTDPPWAGRSWVRFAAGGAALHLAGLAVFAWNMAAASGARVDAYLAGTAYGRGVFLQTALGVALLVALLIPSKRPRPWGPAAVAVPLVLAHSAYGHVAGTVRPRELGVALGALHLAAAAAWIGGLAYVFLDLGRAGPAPNAAARGTLRRFSRLAAASVVLLVVTGAWMLFEVHGRALSWSWIAFDREYSGATSVKVVLILVLLGLAAVSRRLAQRMAEWGSPLKSNVKRELFVGGAVLVAAAWMTSLPLPGPAEQGGVTSDLREPFVVSTLSEHYGYHIVIDPPPRAFVPSEVSIHVFDAKDGGEPARVFRLYVYFRPLSGAQEATEVVMEQTGNASFAARGAFFTSAGEWTGATMIQTAGVYREETRFDVSVTG